MFLVRVADQADVDELRPVGVLGTLATHVDDAVAKRAPLLADHGDAAALEGFQVAVACRNEIAGDAGEQAAPVHTYARLDGLDDRYDARIVTRTGNHDVQIGDVVVLFLEVSDRVFLVDRENTVNEGILRAKADILDVQVAYR